jgi:glycerol uptake facilitator-like aquaporin
MSDQHTSLLPKNNKETVNKESSSFDSDLLIQALYESIGTMMFMVIIYYCAGDVSKFVFGFWIILSIFGGLSGAHVNPAITLGFYVYEGDFIGGLPKLLLYWLAQLVGAFLGASISKPLFLNDLFVQSTKNTFEIFWAEFFFTGTFCFVILYVCSKKVNLTESAPIKCAMIVGWFYAIVNAGASISGAAYNPAILTVLNISAQLDNQQNAIVNLPIMIFAELLGVSVFSIIFKYAFERYIDEKNKAKQY